MGGSCDARTKRSLATAFRQGQRRDETIFGDEVVSLQEHSDAVEVQFRSGRTRRFGLVIGADGLNSNVRRQMFGSQDRFETHLGNYAAAFQVNGYRPRDDLTKTIIPSADIAILEAHEGMKR